MGGQLDGRGGSPLPLQLELLLRRPIRRDHLHGDGVKSCSQLHQFFGELDADRETPGQLANVPSRVKGVGDQATPGGFVPRGPA